MVIQADGTLDSHGIDNNGELSHPNGEFDFIDSNEQHSCGIRTNATIQCWGEDGNDEIYPP